MRLLFWKKKPEDKKPATKKDYEALGRQVAAVYEAVNPDRKAVYRTAFFTGILRGVGTVIGATIVIALLLWLLSLFTNIPLIGDFVESIQNTIEQDDSML